MDESRNAVMLESRDAVMGRLRREALVGREAKDVVERKKGRGKKSGGRKKKGELREQRHFFKGALAVRGRPVLWRARCCLGAVAGRLALGGTATGPVGSGQRAESEQVALRRVLPTTNPIGPIPLRRWKPVPGRQAYCRARQDSCCFGRLLGRY